MELPPEDASPEALAALRAELGLDRPLPLRYLAWVGGMLGGDFGAEGGPAGPGENGRW